MHATRGYPSHWIISGKMHAVWLWASCCLGFFGFIRAGEFTSSTPRMAPDATMSAEDIGIDSPVNPRVLVVHLWHSKMDPFSAGVCLFLGRTGDILCPVKAVLGYLAMRPPGLGPLFVFQRWQPTLKSTFGHANARSIIAGRSRHIKCFQA